MNSIQQEAQLLLHNVKSRCAFHFNRISFAMENFSLGFSILFFNCAVSASPLNLAHSSSDTKIFCDDKTEHYEADN